MKKLLSETLRAQYLVFGSRVAGLRAALDVALAMARSALFRGESRGSHFPADFPDSDEIRLHGHTLLDSTGPRLVDLEVSLLSSARC